MKKSRPANLKINTNLDYDLLKFKDIKNESCKNETNLNKFKNLNYLNSPSSGLLNKLSKNKITPKANDQRVSLADDNQLNREIIKGQRIQFSPQNKSTIKTGLNFVKSSSKTPTNKMKPNLKLIAKEINNHTNNTNNELNKKPLTSNLNDEFETILNSNFKQIKSTKNLFNPIDKFNDKKNLNFTQEKSFEKDSLVITNTSTEDATSAKYRPDKESSLGLKVKKTHDESPISSNKFKYFQSYKKNNVAEESLISENKIENNQKEIESNIANESIDEMISVSTLINNQNIPLMITNLSVCFPDYESSKFSTKSLGGIRAYAANTYQGIIRTYNEDRVSIILNIARPNGFKGVWPKCSFFGIYDGHGGANCADFLRDELHSYVIRDSHFPSNPVEALRRGFQRAEEEFINRAYSKKSDSMIDKSGSCAVACLIVDDYCYVANVGDSRAVLSINGGETIEVLTTDHKPNEDSENKRIFNNGGKVYQTQTPTKIVNFANNNSTSSTQILIGPYRVFPGRLSVSRTFGDVEAKLPKLGGIPGVVIAIPEIKVIRLNKQSDFLLLGCDGVFDQLTNKDAIECVWMTMTHNSKAADIHSQCALACDMVMKSSLVRRTLDNITVLIVAFDNFENNFNRIGRKDEYFSIKNSFYLSKAIDNKDYDDFYCQTEPIIDVIDKTNIHKVKSLSPQNRSKEREKDIHSSQYLTHSKNFNSFNFNGKNKIASLETNKKLVLSPKFKKNEKKVNIPDCGGTGNKIEKSDKSEKRVNQMLNFSKVNEKENFSKTRDVFVRLNKGSN